ncbi:MAG: hypothetical protein FJ167_01745 [Gammaproteobacteria bacterium]|nr:hypothetical protein [Gammaproteobacteria bacterium]
MAKPTAKAPDLGGLTDLLRDLFSTLAAPPPKLKAPKAPDSASDDEEDEDDDDAMRMPLPMPPMGKGMRRLTISILMPAKGKKGLPRAK